MTLTNDQLEARIVALEAQAATREELSTSFLIQGKFGASSQFETEYQGGGFIYSFWVAPYDCRLVSVDLVKDYEDVPKNSVNYAHVAITREDATNTRRTIVAKTTAMEGIVARRRWSFAGATWDQTAATFAAGDVAQFYLKTVGTASWRFPMSLTTRVVPL